MGEDSPVERAHKGAFREPPQPREFSSSAQLRKEASSPALPCTAKIPWPAAGAFHRWKDPADAVFQPEAQDARIGQHQRGKLPAVQLGEAGLDVAAHAFHPHPGKEASQLERTARTRRAERLFRVQAVRALRQNQHVARVGTAGIGQDGSPSGCSIGRSLRLCTAKSMRPSRSARSSSFTKRPLRPTRVERAVENQVARRFHRHELQLPVGMRPGGSHPSPVRSG